MNILMIGDVFGSPGTAAVKHLVPNLRDEENISFVVANGENAADGRGITPEIIREFIDAGVDVITSGNHFRDQTSIDQELISNPRVLRPHNYDDVPGSGIATISVQGQNISVINLAGLVHMKQAKSPFEKIDELISDLKTKSKIILMDFHAEATSEKRAMGYFVNGKVSAVVGTHTHVQTADEQILSEGTAYITDLGMTGPYESVIGLDIQAAFTRFANLDRKPFKVATDDIRLSGAIINIDESNGRATSIKRMQIPFGSKI